MKHVYFGVLALLAAAASCGTSSQVPAERPDHSAEMVNIGYETTTQGDLSYSVTSLKPDDKEMVYSNMYDYLRGRVPGVHVGPENTPSAIHVRGINSINSSTAPLILVDGMETDLDTVNPHDVSSVDVLKDSSSSIYGVRGANGVILITTKAAQQQQEALAAAKKKARADKKAARAAKKK